jgi:hypothetical protein
LRTQHSCFAHAPHWLCVTRLATRRFVFVSVMLAEFRSGKRDTAISRG